MSKSRALVVSESKGEGKRNNRVCYGFGGLLCYLVTEKWCYITKERNKRNGLTMRVTEAFLWYCYNVIDFLKERERVTFKCVIRIALADLLVVSISPTLNLEKSVTL